MRYILHRQELQVRVRDMDTIRETNQNFDQKQTIDNILKNAADKLTVKIKNKNCISSNLYKAVHLSVGAMARTPSTGMLGDAIKAFFVIQPCLFQKTAIWEDPCLRKTVTFIYS